MSVNKVAFTAVGLACVAAAGAGGYLALRQNAPEPAQTVATATPSPADTAQRPLKNPFRKLKRRSNRQRRRRHRRRP